MFTRSSYDGWEESLDSFVRHAVKSVISFRLAIGNFGGDRRHLWNLQCKLYVSDFPYTSSKRANRLKHNESFLASKESYITSPQSPSRSVEG